MSTYATIDDVKIYLPLCSLPSLTNDGNPGALSVNEDLVAECINAAEAEIDSYVVSQYDLIQAHAINPDWLRHCSAIVTCVWISRLGANGTVPPGLQSLYDEKLNALQKIQLGQRMIPGLSTRADPGVSMSNLTYDPRWDLAKIRTQPAANTSDQNSVVPRNTNYVPTVY